jgi:DNA-binding transcriptional MerR regulator
MIEPVPPRERLVRIGPAARFLSVHPDTLRRWSDARLIRHYRLGPRRDRFYDRIDLEDYVVVHRRDPHV